MSPAPRGHTDFYERDAVAYPRTARELAVVDDREPVRFTSARPISVTLQRCRSLQVSPLVSATRTRHEHFTKAAGHGAEQPRPRPARARRVRLARRPLPCVARQRRARALRHRARAERRDIRTRRSSPTRWAPASATATGWRGSSTRGSASRTRCTSPWRWPTSATPRSCCATPTSAAPAGTVTSPSSAPPTSPTTRPPRCAKRSTSGSASTPRTS